MIRTVLSRALVLSFFVTPNVDATIGGQAGQRLPSFVGLPLPCAGTKAGATFILTAGHCTSMQGADGKIEAFYSPGKTIGVTGLYAESGVPEVRVILKVRHLFLHPTWIAGVEKHAADKNRPKGLDVNVAASWDPTVSDLAILEVEPDPEFDRIPVAPLKYQALVLGEELKVGGLARLGDRSIHTSHKKVSAIHPRVVRVDRTDADGKSLSNFFTGDSGGAVYDSEENVVGVAVGTSARKPSEEERKKLDVMLGNPGEAQNKTILEMTGYALNFEEFLQVMYSGESNIVRIDDTADDVPAGPWIREILNRS